MGWPHRGNPPRHRHEISHPTMKKRHFSYLLVTVSCLLLCAHAEHKGAVNADALARIDDVVQAAIQRGEVPGAVVPVLHRGEVVLRKSYGLRSKQPAEAPMTVDTIFDLASLTKPLATATS